MGIQIERIGHIGILVSDFERSFKFYTEVLGCKVTARRKRPDGSEGAFLRFDEWHHDFVTGTAPAGVDVTKPEGKERLIQQISFALKDRDAFVKRRLGDPGGIRTNNARIKSLAKPCHSPSPLVVDRTTAISYCRVAS